MHLVLFVYNKNLQTVKTSGTFVLLLLLHRIDNLTGGATQAQCCPLQDFRTVATSCAKNHKVRSSSSSVIFNGSLHPKMLHYCPLLGLLLHHFQILRATGWVQYFSKTDKPLLSLHHDLSTQSPFQTSVVLPTTTLNILLWLTYFLQLISKRSMLSSITPITQPSRMFLHLKNSAIEKAMPCSYSTYNYLLPPI